MTPGSHLGERFADCAKLGVFHRKGWQNSREYIELT